MPELSPAQCRCAPRMRRHQSVFLKDASQELSTTPTPDLVGPVTMQVRPSAGPPTSSRGGTPQSASFCTTSTTSTSALQHPPPVQAPSRTPTKQEVRIPGSPPGTAPPRRPAPRRSRNAAPWRPPWRGLARPENEGNQKRGKTNWKRFGLDLDRQA